LYYYLKETYIKGGYCILYNVCDYPVLYTYYEDGALLYLERLEIKLIYGLKCEVSMY